MKEACSLIWTVLIGLFRTRSSLVAEILVLRHQINVLRRHSPTRQTFSSADRLIFAWLYRLVAPTVLNALAIVKPETVIKWHSAGFRSYWRWKSRRGGGRPTVPPKVRKLIREMSIANPLWGAVCTGKLNPRVAMVKSGQDGVRTYGTGSLNRPRIRRIFV
jgi:hypothetical protein